MSYPHPQSSQAVIDCALVDMKIKSGIGQLEEILLATPNLIVEGRGDLNCTDGAIDVALAPTSKTPSFGSLHEPVHIDGWVADPHVGLDWKSVLPRLSQQAPASVTAPLLEEPFFKALGEQENSACRRALDLAEVSTKDRH